MKLVKITDGLLSDLLETEGHHSGISGTSVGKQGGLVHWLHFLPFSFAQVGRAVPPWRCTIVSIQGHA